MKASEREEARRLRSKEGLSVGEIAHLVGVSKGTASMWLRDVIGSNEAEVSGET